MQEHMHQAETLPGHALFHLVVLLYAQLTGARAAGAWVASRSQSANWTTQQSGRFLLKLDTVVL